MNTPATPSPFVSQVLAAIQAANAIFAPAAAAPVQGPPPSATEAKRAELHAKLAAETDNRKRWEIAEAINALPWPDEF